MLSMVSEQHACWAFTRSLLVQQVAWGQLYIDAGDQKDLGPASSGWLNLRAEAQPYGTGVLTGTFSSTGACCCSVHPA